MIHLREETPPYQLVTPPFTSSSVDALPGNKIAISSNKKSKQQVPSTQSYGKSFFLKNNFLVDFFRIKNNKSIIITT
jgi:hypothetical protein